MTILRAVERHQMHIYFKNKLTLFLGWWNWCVFLNWWNMGAFFGSPNRYSSLPNVLATAALYLHFSKSDILLLCPLISVISHSNLSFSEMRRFYSAKSKNAYNNRQIKNKKWLERVNERNFENSRLIRKIL